MDAMNYLHGRKIMHRDIKLENILLKFDSEEDKKNLNIMKSQIKIIDFGFATSKTLTTTVVGNLKNMDPLLIKKNASR